MPHGHIPPSYRRYGWCTGSYLPKVFGITIGHIGRPITEQSGCPSLQPLLFFVEIFWRRKGNSPHRESIPAMSTCSGMERLEPVASGNLAKTYSAPAHSVPSVRSLGDRSTWLTQTRVLGNDTDQGFTRPLSLQSERRVDRRPGFPYTERVVGLMIMQKTRSNRLGKRCC